MNFKEVQRLLKMMNVDMNEDHALRLFQVSTTPEGLERLERGWRGWNKLHNTSLQKDVLTFLCPSFCPSIDSYMHACMHASIHLFVYPTTCLPRHPFVHLSVNQPAKAAVPPAHCPPSCISVHSPILPAVYLSINPTSQPHVHVSIPLSLPPSLHLFVHLSIHAPIHLPVHPASLPSANPSIHPCTHPSIHALINAYHCHWHGVSVPSIGGGQTPSSPMGWPGHPILPQLGAECCSLAGC